VVMSVWPWYGYAITPQSVFLTVTFNMALAMAMWSHYKAMTSDPGLWTSLVLDILNLSSCFQSFFFSFSTCCCCSGAVPLPQPGSEIPEALLASEPFEKLGEMVTVCKKCNCYKPLVAHHCSTCGRCIRKLDHHCPCKPHHQGFSLSCWTIFTNCACSLRGE